MIYEYVLADGVVSIIPIFQLYYDKRCQQRSAQHGLLVLRQMPCRIRHEASAAFFENITFDFTLFGLNVKRWVDMGAEYYDAVQSVRLAGALSADNQQANHYSYSRSPQESLFIQDRFPTRLPALELVHKL
jgi:hypothetical protein